MTGYVKEILELTAARETLARPYFTLRAERQRFRHGAETRQRSSPVMGEDAEAAS